MNNQWHTKSIAEVLTALSSSERGLTKEEAGRRFKKYGLNKLPEGKIDSFPVIFLRQFQSPLIYILLVAAVIVFAMGKIVDGFVILIVLVFNAIVGTIQEGRARNIFLALKKFSETSATVMRDGKEILVRDVEVVPGDIIVLQEGEKVPADARIIFTNILKVDEASLTGESEPISKTNVILTTEQLLVTDQKNMVFKGTHIVSGNCLAVVVATGLATEIGKIAQKITAIDTEIPLKANIRYLSRLIILTILIINSFLVILGVFFGKSIEEMFMRDSRHTAQKLLGQNTKKKNVLSFFRKNRSRANPKSKEHFSLGLPSEARQWRGFCGVYDSIQSHHALRICDTLPILKIDSNLVQ